MQTETAINIDPDNGWSDDVEHVLESIRHNASVLSNHHRKKYSYYSGQLKYYKIPVIIISGFNSVTAVGLQPYIAQQHISVTNCLLALLVGIIGSIELFLGISAGAESELKASKDFYLLSIDIYLTLSLDRERRPPAKTYLDHKYTEYSDLFRGSTLIQNRKIVDKLSSVDPVSCKKSKVDGSLDTSKIDENLFNAAPLKNGLFGNFSDQSSFSDNTSSIYLGNRMLNNASDEIGKQVKASSDLGNRMLNLDASDEEDSILKDFDETLILGDNSV